jgi:hypothetical protein
MTLADTNARAEMADVLPIAPKLLGFQAEHYEKRGLPLTVIIRRFDRPDLCHLCPEGFCNHDDGFCRVEAPGHVPKRQCARYAMPKDAAAAGGIPDGAEAV